MNNPIRNLGVFAFAAAVPLAAFAQSNSQSPSSSTSGSTRSTDTTRSSSYSSPSTTSNATNPSSAAPTTSDSTMPSSLDTTRSGSGVASIHRVSNDVVDRQFTAKQLIGKDVYDSRDKKIGEVKDVILDSTGAQQLASALATRTMTRSSGSSSTASGAGTTGSTAGTASTSSTGSTSSGMKSSTGSPGSGSSVASNSSLSSLPGATGGPAAIVSFGGFMGVGNNLLQVPLSQLRYDAARDHITLNVTETELSSLKDVSDTARSATE